MAATYAQLAQIATLTTFTSRVAYAMALQASIVAAESSGTVGHGTRYNFAVKVASGNYSLAAACNAVLTNTTVLADISSGSTDSTILDADIQTAVAAVWNLLAGV